MLWRLRVSLAVMFWVFVVSVGQAQKRLVDIEDYFTQAFVIDCEMAPNSQWVAYVELRWEPPQESRNADLWLVNTQTQQTRRLTYDVSPDTSPQWSVDSRYLYFTSRRKRGDGTAPPYNGKSQVFRYELATKQITPVTRRQDGIQSYHISADGNAIYYTVAANSDDPEWKALRAKHATLNYGRGKVNVSQLWRLDLKTWREDKLVDNHRYIREFAVSPDQRYVGMITAGDDLLITHEGWSNVDVFDAQSGKVETLNDDLWRKNVPSPHGWLEHPTWSADGKRLAFRTVYDGYPAEILCADLAAKKSWYVKRPPAITVYGGHMEWRDDDLFFQGQWRARERVYRVSDVKNGGQGRVAAVVDGDVVVGDFSVTASGRQIATIHSTPTAGRDLHLVDVTEPQKAKQLTMTNPQMKDWKLPQISIVKWTGANNTVVEGILELPPDYKPGDGPLPTILHIHGGPTAASMYEFRFWPYGRTLMASKGYALLSPNYRGSSGYGDKFMVDLVGHENEVEVIDLLNGINMLVAKEIADPKRLGVMGWSNGGFLTNAVITKTQRFKAASSGAGVIDQVMQWGLEDTPGHVINFVAGSQPWNNALGYGRASPVFRLGQVTTPTLIHVGEKDARVPAAHSRTLFRALHRYRKIPTQLLVYPGMGHSPLTYSYRKAKMEWDMAWFDRYILEKKK